MPFVSHRILCGRYLSPGFPVPPWYGSRLASILCSSMSAPTAGAVQPRQRGPDVWFWPRSAPDQRGASWAVSRLCRPSRGLGGNLPVGAPSSRLRSVAGPWKRSQRNRLSLPKNRGASPIIQRAPPSEFRPTQREHSRGKVSSGRANITSREFAVRGPAGGDCVPAALAQDERFVPDGVR